MNRIIHTSDDNNNIVNVSDNKVKYYQELAENSAESAQQSANQCSNFVSSAQRILGECENVKNDINIEFVSEANSHLLNFTNPHRVSSEQVFSYSKDDVDIIVEDVLVNHVSDGDLLDIVSNMYNKISNLDGQEIPDEELQVQQIVYDNYNAEVNENGENAIIYRDTQIIFDKNFLSELFGGIVEEDVDVNVLADNRVSFKIKLPNEKIVSYPIYLPPKSSVIALGNQSASAERGLSSEYKKTKVFSYVYNPQTKKISNVQIFYPQGWVSSESDSQDLLLTEDNYKISRLYLWCAEDGSYIYSDYGSVKKDSNPAQYVHVSKFWDSFGNIIDTSELIVDSSELPNIGVVINDKTFWILDSELDYFYEPSNPYPKTVFIRDEDY